MVDAIKNEKLTSTSNFRFDEKYQTGFFQMDK